MIHELAIANCTTKEATRTNLCYLHPDTRRALKADKIRISFGANALVHRVAPDPALQPSQVGTNSLVRAVLKLTENDVQQQTKVGVEAYKPGPIPLYRLHIEVGTFNRNQTIVKSMEVDDHVRQVFSKETFCPGQNFASKMGSTGWLKLTITKCLIPDHVDGVKETQAGEIDEKTQIILTPTANRKIVWQEPKQPKVNIGPNFDGESLGIGGLNKQFAQIFRRAFASRLLSAKVVKELGIKHVKGMLLHGPPGTGKTLIARKIGGMLTEREPKVVNGPEILNRFVGASEEKIRELFNDARNDQAENGEDADLHIIIFDEIDSICKARGSVGGGTGVHDTVVNQLLSMIDGVDALNNILVIGMTNRKDLIDTALLRSGRLEVHLEIGLPDHHGREQIFRIKTKDMRESGRLGADVDLSVLADRTKNYSGAEIEGVVKSASSWSYYSKLDSSDIKSLNKKMEGVKVMMEHFEMALDEVKPEFGVAEEALSQKLERGFYPYGGDFDELMKTGDQLLKQVRNADNNTRRLSLLLKGPIGCGKTGIACQLAKKANYPFVKLVSAEDMVAFGDQTKALKIHQTFEDAYKSDFSIIILDDIERLLGYTKVGMRFSSRVMETLQVLCRKDPPLGRSICIIATSTDDVVKDLYLEETFDVIRSVPLVKEREQIISVMKSLNCQVDATNLELISSAFNTEVGIKNLLMIIESAMGADGTITHNSFKEAMELYGYEAKDY